MTRTAALALSLLLSACLARSGDGGDGQEPPARHDFYEASCGSDGALRCALSDDGSDVASPVFGCVDADGRNVLDATPSCRDGAPTCRALHSSAAFDVACCASDDPACLR